MGTELSPRTGGSARHDDAASVDHIRSQFPAIRRTYRGFPAAYFDGPGGTQVPTSVVDAVSDYLCNHNANTHWNYPTSLETDEMLERSRLALADFLGGGARRDCLRRERDVTRVPRLTSARPPVLRGRRNCHYRGGSPRPRRTVASLSQRARLHASRSEDGYNHRRTQLG
jgi:hypothetical protein